MITLGHGSKPGPRDLQIPWAFFICGVHVRDRKTEWNSIPKKTEGGCKDDKQQLQT
jgi:hypothetical protein